jgi:GTP:adenosylcobinamide-phosphate guanylyltransferase
MIQWVVDALSLAKEVDNILVIGLPKDKRLISSKRLDYLEDQGSLLGNIVGGVNRILEVDHAAEFVLVVSSDIPAITAGMVDGLVERSRLQRADIYYGLVPRPVMERRFPGSKRTFTKFRDIQVCGADINIVHVSMATHRLDLWEELIGSRKQPLKQAARIGYMTLFKLLTGRLTVDEAVQRITTRIGITGCPIIWDQAEPAMDVDKPHQLEILRRDLAFLPDDTSPG